MRLRSVVFPEPEGPISATKSPRGISSVSPCRTSIFCLPRSYTLVTLRTWTIDSDMVLLLTVWPRSRFGLAHGRAVCQVCRAIDDHQLTRSHAGKELAGVAARAAKGDTAALRAVRLEHEHDVLVAILAQRRCRHE